MRRFKILKRYLIFWTIIVSVFILYNTKESFGAISLSLDNSLIDFRAMDTGETMEVSDKGFYHNEITCSSTNDQTWYLKAQLIRPFQYGMHTIPAENFEWVVVSIGGGTGVVNGDMNRPNSFSVSPTGLIYTSGAGDNSGNEIRIQLRYKLTVPKNSIAGSYNATIRLIMTEVL